MPKGGKESDPKVRNKPGPKRSGAQRADDAYRILRLVERGYTQLMIARELGVSHQQVSFDYRRIIRRSMEERVNSHEAVETKLLELELLKREALEAWERSKEPAVEIVDVESDLNSSHTEKKKGQCGDPKYLAIVADCIKQERSIRGLDVPKEVHVQGKMTNVNIDWNVFMDVDNHDRNLVEERMKLLLEGKPVPPLYSKGDLAQEEAESDEFPPYEEPDEPNEEVEE